MRLAGLGDAAAAWPRTAGPPYARPARARLRRQRVAELEIDAELGAEAAAGFLERVRSCRRRRHRPGARRRRSPSARSPCRRRRPRSSTCRRRCRRSSPSRRRGSERAAAPEPWAAITVSRLSPAQTATSLPAWRGEQFADLARIAPAHRHAGEDQRAGVDLVRIDIGALVLLLDEGAERRRRRSPPSAA